MSSEIENIIERYKRREQQRASISDSRVRLFENYRNREREAKYSKAIRSRFKNDLSALSVIEIGAGNGINIQYFKRIGIRPQNIWANELLDARVEALQKEHADINILPGDALGILINKKFDIVFQSMVFSSILDPVFRKLLAEKMLSLLSEDGIIIWYDFIYNNPRNKDVRCVNRREIQSLFHDTELTYQKVTLFPFIARRIGMLYWLFNTIFPFLRTHLVAIIRKPSAN